MPQSRPMPSIGRRCHELRITDGDLIWRIVYRVDSDAMSSSTRLPRRPEQFAQKDIDRARSRFKDYDETTK